MHENKKYPTNEQSVGQSKADHLMSENASEAAASLFNSKMNHKQPELRFRYMFSELDIGTKQDVVWDLWIRFPFKVPKQKAEKFKEAVNELFKATFLD